MATEKAMTSLLSEFDEVCEERDLLRKALTAVDVSMDTAAIHGVKRILPPAYRDSWAEHHKQAKAALEQTK